MFKGVLKYMFEKLTINEKTVLTGFLLVFAVISAVTGFYGGRAYNNSPTGNMVSNISKENVRKDVQKIMDYRMSSQEQRLLQIADRNENMSSEKVSLKAEVGLPEGSRFEGLIKIPINVSGTIPSETEEEGLVRKSQNIYFYVSEDGNYLFQQPTKIDEMLKGISSALKGGMLK